jgi:ribulose-phosphate 3-epimerase
MENIIISPSILSADFANLQRDIELVENAGADWLHIDVMDGHFVPNITIGVPVVKSIRAITKLPLDVHLMIENPEKYIEPFAMAGADIITFHYEAVAGEGKNKVNITGTDAIYVEEEEKSFLTDYPPELKIYDLIVKIKSYGIKAGLSIKPKTSEDVLLPYLKDLDMVLVMTVEPGFGGQAFMPDCAKKIEAIRKNAKDDLIIQVDGGINDFTGRVCKDFGANSLVAGNYIYKSDDVKKAIELLKS